MAKLASYVQPIHFEDFDGSQFERLVFAYHARTHDWRSLEWYGQTGNDLGRDIWGVRRGDGAGESVCIQCVNRKKLAFAKIKNDISKVLKADGGVPHLFRIVTQSNVSAGIRDKIKKHVRSLGVSECEVWSGAEFEEFLRRGAQSLLKRFIEGDPFPDAASELRKYAAFTKPRRRPQKLSTVKFKAAKARIDVAIAKAQLEHVHIELAISRARLAELTREQKIGLYVEEIRRLETAQKAKHGSQVWLSGVNAAPGEDPELVQIAFRKLRAEGQGVSNSRWSRGR